MRAAKASASNSISQLPKKRAAARPFTSNRNLKSLGSRVDDRTLVLTGNLSGFYRVGSGPQTRLSGSKATFNYSSDNLNALIESGDNSQVELLLPAETGKPDALGPVTLRADSIRVDQKNGAAYFTGNARAFSTSGTNKLDVAAPSFTLNRAPPMARLAC